MTEFPADGLERDGATPAFGGEKVAGVPSLPAFDPSKYRAELADLKLTDEQERELLATLWSIMYNFVELGFRTDVCAMIFEGQENVADDTSSPVDSLGNVFRENSRTDRGPT